MQELKEKAPVQSCNSDGGIYPNITKGIDMTNSLTQTPTVNEKTDYTQMTVTVIKQLADEQGVKPSKFWNQTNAPALDPHKPSRTNTPFQFQEPTPLEIAYAEQFQDYTVKINYCKQTHVFTETEGDDVYRFYGGLAVTPEHKEILVNVFVGANEKDFDTLANDYVKAIRAGYWNSIPWKRMTSLKHGFEFFKVTLGSNRPAQGDLIYPCTEERCESFGRHHLVDRHDPTDLPVHYCDLMAGENYRLQLLKEQGEWLVDAETYRPLTPTESASYASDLMWLAAEAKKLNDAGGKSLGVIS